MVNRDEGSIPSPAPTSENSKESMVSVNPASANPGKMRIGWWRRTRAGDIFWLAAALAGVLLILLHESLFFGKGLVPADGVLNWPPWNQATRPSNIQLAESIRVFLPAQEFVHQQKGFPLWNPNLCCGAPNLGSIQGRCSFRFACCCRRWIHFRRADRPLF